MILYLRKLRQRIKEVVEHYGRPRLWRTSDTTEPCSLILWGRLVRPWEVQLHPSGHSLLLWSKDSLAFLTSGPGGVTWRPSLRPSVSRVDLWVFGWLQERSLSHVPCAVMHVECWLVRQKFLLVRVQMGGVPWCSLQVDSQGSLVELSVQCSCLAPAAPRRSFSTWTVGTAFSSMSGVRESVRGDPGEKKPGSGAGSAGSSEVLVACCGVMGF